MALLQSIKRRILWEYYRLGVSATWLQWDFYDRIYRGQSLQTETIYECKHSDPLAQDPIGKFLWANMHVIPPAESLEFVRVLQGPVMLEPVSGYAIAPPGRLVLGALAKTEYARDRRHMNEFSGVPSVRDYKSAVKGERKVQHIPKIVTFRHPFAKNYFHYLVDVMSRLYLLDLAGVDQTVPILVGSDLAKCSFFTDMIKRGSLENRTWIVQTDEYIETDELIYVKTSEDNPAKLRYLLDQIGVGQANPNSSRRIFLTRSERRGRYLRNMDVVLPILEELNLEIVDTDGWSIDDQIQLFQSCSLVVGLHGAGLTNIIYRNSAPLKLIEIYPPTYSPPCIYQIAKQFGYEYDYLIGTDAIKTPTGLSYRISPDELREKLTGS